MKSKGVAKAATLFRREAICFNLRKKVITVCDAANESCPIFPGKTQKLHWGFPDPAKATGTEEEILDEFRAVRDQIRQKFDDHVEEF